MRRVRARACRLLPLLAALLLGLVACHSEGGAPLPERCSLNSDCKEGLICALGACRMPCKKSVDCGNGGSCVTDGISAVCQPLEEKDDACNKTAECPAPLACAGDYRCRNLCESDDDCNVLGIRGRVCAEDDHGQHYCGEPEETKDGVFIVDPAPGARIREPDEDAGAQGSTEAGTSMEMDSAVDPGMDAAVGVDAQSVTDASPALDANTGVDASTWMDADTGVAANPEVDADAGGDADVGADADAGEGGVPPEAGLDAGSCGSLNGAQCCAGPVESACTGSLTCNAGRCGCVSALSASLVQKTDGTLWSYKALVTNQPVPVQIKFQDGSSLLPRSFGEGPNHACALLQDGSVWCWSFSNGNAPNGELGNGTTTRSAVPVQVLTALAGGTPLSGIQQLSVGFSTTCAVGAQGAVWCWGAGANNLLANGSTTNSAFATPALTQSAGPQLDGVSKLAVSHWHSCALKSDNSVWCWGRNVELETGQPAAATIPFPLPVSGLPSVTDLVLNDYVSCVLSAGTPHCWGLFNFVGRDLTSGNVMTPTAVLATGGAALDDVGELVPYLANSTTTGMCALRHPAGDRSIWCWGQNAAKGIVVPGSPAVVAVQRLGAGAFVDSMGRVIRATTPATPAFSCN